MKQPIDISGIENGQRSEAELKRELAERKEKEAEQIETVRSEIIDGGTTRDLLRDLVIVRTHSLDQEAVDMYQDLSARVAAHVGEPVLVIGNEEEQTSFGGPGKRSRERGVVRTRFALGILAEESLRLDIPKGDWTFPTERYAFRSDKLRRGTVLEEGPLGTGECVGFLNALRGNPYEWALGKELPLRCDHIGLELQPPPILLEVHIGDAEIQAYLDREFDDFMAYHQHRARLYNELAELIGAPKRTLLSEDEFRSKYQERAKDQG